MSMHLYDFFTTEETQNDTRVFGGDLSKNFGVSSALDLFGKGTMLGHRVQCSYTVYTLQRLSGYLFICASICLSILVYCTRTYIYIYTCIFMCTYVDI